MVSSEAVVDGHVEEEWFEVSIEEGLHDVEVELGVDEHGGNIGFYDVGKAFRGILRGPWRKRYH